MAFLKLQCRHRLVHRDELVFTGCVTTLLEDLQNIRLLKEKVFAELQLRELVEEAAQSLGSGGKPKDKLRKDSQMKLHCPDFWIRRHGRCGLVLQLHAVSVGRMHPEVDVLLPSLQHHGQQVPEPLLSMGFLKKNLEIFLVRVDLLPRLSAVGIRA